MLNLTAKEGFRATRKQLRYAPAHNIITCIHIMHRRGGLMLVDTLQLLIRILGGTFATHLPSLVLRPLPCYMFQCLILHFSACNIEIWEWLQDEATITQWMAFFTFNIPLPPNWANWEREFWTRSRKPRRATTELVSPSSESWMGDKNDYCYIPVHEPTHCTIIIITSVKTIE